MEAARNFLEQAALHDLVIMKRAVNFSKKEKFQILNFVAKFIKKIVRYTQKSQSDRNCQSTGWYGLKIYIIWVFSIQFFNCWLINLKAIQLKNAIYSKEEAIKLQHQERWLQMQEDVRNYIKNNCIETLGSETKRPSQAAQCVGYIACAELPRGLWPDCISKSFSK